MKNIKNQSGFSLVELLVVVIIIAIIAAIAIPNLLASRRAANESSAVSSLRTIHSAQATFFATNGGNTTYAANLGALGAGTVSAPGAGLIDPALESGAKSGYNFAVSSGAGQIYCASGEATTQGTTGTRSFAVSQPGVIYQYAAAGGAAACAAGALTVGAGTAIQ